MRAYFTAEVFDFALWHQEDANPFKTTDQSI
jgi:hypothetical protein